MQVARCKRDASKRCSMDASWLALPVILLVQYGFTFLFACFVSVCPSFTHTNSKSIKLPHLHAIRKAHLSPLHPRFDKTTQRVLLRSSLFERLSPTLWRKESGQNKQANTHNNRKSEQADQAKARGARASSSHGQRSSSPHRQSTSSRPPCYVSCSLAACMRVLVSCVADDTLSLVSPLVVLVRRFVSRRRSACSQNQVCSSVRFMRVWV